MSIPNSSTKYNKCLTSAKYDKCVSSFEICAVIHPFRYNCTHFRAMHRHSWWSCMSPLLIPLFERPRLATLPRKMVSTWYASFASPARDLRRSGLKQGESWTVKQTVDQSTHNPVRQNLGCKDLESAYQKVSSQQVRSQQSPSNPSQQSQVQVNLLILSS